MAMRTGHPFVPSLKISGRDYVPAADLDRARAEAQQWEAIAKEAVRTLDRIQVTIATLKERVKRASSGDPYSMDMFDETPAAPTTLIAE
ncbi:MAG: hypothetical protein ACK5VI_10730 [Opitutia bacterium]|jgi:hypothetical protein